MELKEGSIVRIVSCRNPVFQHVVYREPLEKNRWIVQTLDSAEVTFKREHEEIRLSLEGLSVIPLDS